MDREIKFRVWDKAERKMYYRLLFEGDTALDVCNPFHRERWNLDRMVLMQYTGQDDIEGNKIYEGDVLETNRGIECEVFWNNEKGQYDVRYVNVWDLRKSPKQKTFPYFYYKKLFWAAKRSKIVGNVYENPSLMF